MSKYKYLTNFKKFQTPYGKITKGTQTSHEYRLGDKVIVDDKNEKHGGKEGFIIVPTDLHKTKDDHKEMVKVEFEDGKSDYISIFELGKI